MEMGGHGTRLLLIALLLPFSPLLFLISCLLRLLAILLSRLDGNYAKFISFFDGAFNEDFVRAKPRNVIVSTMELDGDLTLEELRSLFRKNVLCASIPVPVNGRGEVRQALRYPELQQYLTSLLGFRVWRWDRSFRIENHVWEEHPKSVGERVEVDLEELHGKYLNLKFSEDRSPWELILIRNVVGVKGNGEDDVPPEEGSGNVKTLLVLRTHHILGDGVSILKLIVEGLGQKELKMPNAKFPDAPWILKALYPFHVGLEAGRTLYFGWKYYSHPWKELDDESRIIVKFAKPVPVDEIKQIAKDMGVRYSAVILAVISGGIRRYDGKLGEFGVPIGCILPKLGHPKTLVNHWYANPCKWNSTAAVDILPTDEKTPKERLLRCNQIFNSLKRPERNSSSDFLIRLAGSLPNFLNKFFAVNFFTPVGVSNVAGETELFEIGGRKCLQLVGTFGVNRGCTSVMLGSLSYLGSVRFSVIVKESIFGEIGAAKLASCLEEELQTLRALASSKEKMS